MLSAAWGHSAMALAMGGIQVGFSNVLFHRAILSFPPMEFIMKRSHLAAAALAACCTCATLPVIASSWHNLDWNNVVSQTAVSLSQAIAHATAATGGRAIEAEFKRSKWGNAPGWEVELLTADGMKTEVWVDAQTGQVSQQRSKSAKAQYVAQLGAATLSMEQAIDAATAQVEGRAIGAELESRWNTTVYEVKGAVHKLLINAQDGSVQPLVPATALSLQQAIGKALQTAPGRALEADLDADGKYGLPPFYEVEVLSDSGMKTKLRVDAQSGQASVYKSKQAKAKDRSRLDSAAFSLEQAIETASNHVGGARALEADLDTWQGRTSYEVKLLQDNGIIHKVVLDARDGTVLQQR